MEMAGSKPLNTGDLKDLRSAAEGNRGKRDNLCRLFHGKATSMPGSDASEGEFPL